MPTRRDIPEPGGPEASNQCNKGRFFYELGKPQRWTGKSSTEWSDFSPAAPDFAPQSEIESESSAQIGPGMQFLGPGFEGIVKSRSLFVSSDL
eukprot:3689462-Rhodomonas_salina.1